MSIIINGARIGKLTYGQDEYGNWYLVPNNSLLGDELDTFSPQWQSSNQDSKNSHLRQSIQLCLSL